MPDLEQPDDVLTMQEVCRKLRVKDSWGYNNKTLPWFKAGKHKRLYRRDLDAYIQSRRVVATKSEVMRLRPGTIEDDFAVVMD